MPISGDQLNAAQQWLAAHPDDPRAGPIRAKMKALGVNPDAKNISVLTGKEYVPPPGGADASETLGHSNTDVALHYLAKGLPSAGAIGGSMGGAAVGAPAGPGAIAAGAVGAGIGAAGGRALQFKADQALGYPAPNVLDPGTLKQLGVEAALNAALQGGMGATGLAAGAWAKGMDPGRAQSLLLSWAKLHGAMSPGSAQAVKGTGLEAVWPDVMDELVANSAGGKAVVPAAGAIADKLRLRARLADTAASAATGRPLEQLHPDAAQELLTLAQGGGENTPAVARSLAESYRAKGKLAADNMRSSAVVPPPPKMDDVYAAQAEAGRLGRALPVAEEGAAAMQHLPGVHDAVKGAGLPPLNQRVIDAIKAKLSGGTQLPPDVQKLISGLAPAEQKLALAQLGLKSGDADPTAVQEIFGNLRGDARVAGDASFQSKVTPLVDAAARERVATDQLQSSRAAIARAKGTLGPSFAPDDAVRMGQQQAAAADSAAVGQEAAGLYRKRALDAADASAVAQKFGAGRQPGWYDTQANILDAAAKSGADAQGALNEAEGAGAVPGDGTRYATGARSLDAFVNQHTQRGLQRQAGHETMSAAALMGNRIRHALAESNPWQAGAAVPKAADAASALETEAMTRGLPPVDPALRTRLSTPNDPSVTRGMFQAALEAWLHGDQQAQPQ